MEGKKGRQREQRSERSLSMSRPRRLEEARKGKQVSVRKQDSGRRGRGLGEQADSAAGSVDWAKFTHFKAHQSVKDLERLQRSAKSKGQSVFDADKPDKTGLWPIHWAAINNRSDMIEFMLKNGAKADKKCSNRLFANGTPLHLAAMNGSLEAAAALIDSVHGQQQQQQQQQQDANNKTNKQVPGTKAEGGAGAGKSAKSAGDLLSQRDAEGQTPLMRAAAPRSKRMDVVRDLLRKNFWSLSGRPSEMALYLICNGAQWRDTEPSSGMNLMHLAIVHDYDDIVSLLLFLDKQLLEVPAGKVRAAGLDQAAPRGETRVDLSGVDGYETIDLSDAAAQAQPSVRRERLPSDNSGGSSPAPSEPLIERSQRAEEIVANGLKPLQLAILYGRLAIISRLWHVSEKDKAARGSREERGGGAARGASDEQRSRRTPNKPDDPVSIQKTALEERSLAGRQLKWVLFRASWSSREELGRLLKVIVLKGLVAIDLVLLFLFWAPNYAGVGETGGVVASLQGGLFFITLLLTLALAFRTMFRNPGYLRRNSLQYLDQMSQLLMPFKRPDNNNSKSLIRFDTPSPSGSPNESSGAASTMTTISMETTSAQPAQTSENSKRKALIEMRQGRVQTDLLAQSAQWQAKFNLKDTVRLLCHKCQCVRRPRSRHCNYCNHCVQDFDHHCIYLGCCVGRQNRLDFLAFLVALAIMGAYGCCLSAQPLASRDQGLGIWTALGLLWVLKYLVIGLLLAYQNLRRACLGVSLYEEIRSKRIRYLFGREGPSAEISKSHRTYSTLKGSYWRYDPNRFLTGDLTFGEMLQNFREFANSVSFDQYLMTFICTDTPLGRAVASSDSRIGAAISN